MDAMSKGTEASVRMEVERWQVALCVMLEAAVRMGDEGVAEADLARQLMEGVVPAFLEAARSPALDADALVGEIREHLELPDPGPPCLRLLP